MDQEVEVGATVRLRAEAPAGVGFLWTTVFRPDGSQAVLSNPSTATPTFVADVAGEFVFRLVLVADEADGPHQGVADVVNVHASRFLGIARTYPEHGGTIAAHSPLLVRFSEPVRPDSISVKTVELRDITSAPTENGGTPVLFELTLEDGAQTLVVTPSAPLQPSGRYRLWLSLGLHGLSGRSLRVATAIKFSVEAGVDTTAPRVLGITPATGASAVPLDQPIRVDFSEPVLGTTVTDTSLRLRTAQGDQPVTCERVLLWGGLAVEVVPLVPLSPATCYRLEVDSLVTDLAHNPLAQIAASEFCMGGADTQPPRLLWLDPPDQATAVDPATAIVLTFSEPIASATLSPANLVLTDPTPTAVTTDIRVESAGTVVRLVPTAVLKNDTTYTLSISAALTDRAGNPLESVGGSPWQSRFTTGRVAAGLDHFRVEATPTALVAGESAQVTLSARDENGEVLVNYQNVAPLLLSHDATPSGMTWSGSGVTDRTDGSADLAGGHFKNGVASVTLTSTTVRSGVVLSALERDTAFGYSGTSEALGIRLSWRPGALDHFTLTASDTAATAGQTVRLTARADDAFGNPLTDYLPPEALELLQNGAGAPASLAFTGVLGCQNDLGNGTATLAADASCWTAGQTVVQVSDRVAEGPITFTVREPQGLSGTSPGITWQVGPLDHFTLVATPTELVAGENVTLTLTARDREGNPRTSYETEQVAALRLSQNGGQLGIFWSGPCVLDLGNGSATLASGCISGASATFTLRDIQAEGPVEVSVVEDDSGLFRAGTTEQSGSNITWRPGPLGHFRVTASPTSLPAGSNTVLTIAAEDQSGYPTHGRGNPIPGYVNDTPLRVACVGCAGMPRFARWDTGSGAAVVPAGTLFDGLAQISVAVSNVTAEGPVVLQIIKDTTLESGSTAESLTNVTWLGAGCPPPLAKPALVGPSPTTLCHIALDGSGSDPAAGHSIVSYTWHVVSTPVGSAITDAALVGRQSATPTFVADLAGDYVLELSVVNDCGGNSAKWLLVSYVPGAPSPGDLLLTEVVIEPWRDWDDTQGGDGVRFNAAFGSDAPSADQDQWVELFNASSCAIDLTAGAGWYLWMDDDSPAETRALGAVPTLEFISPQSSLGQLLPGGYVVLGDPAQDGGGKKGRLSSECALAVWYGVPGGSGSILIDRVELDGPGGLDPLGNGDGNGAPLGVAASSAQESVYRKNGPPYANSGTPADWARSTSGATIAADNPQ
jgi:hypothetical protein